MKPLALDMHSDLGMPIVKHGLRDLPFVDTVPVLSATRHLVVTGGQIHLRIGMTQREQQKKEIVTALERKTLVAWGA